MTADEMRGGAARAPAPRALTEGRDDFGMTGEAQIIVVAERQQLLAVRLDAAAGWRVDDAPMPPQMLMIERGQPLLDVLEDHCRSPLAGDGLMTRAPRRAWPACARRE